MAVAVDFATISEMLGRIATKYALGERSVLAHKAERQYRSISCSDLQGYGLTKTAPVLTADRLDGFSMA